MALPESARLEGPILQELLATGGEEKIQLLYDRLIPYFPQLTEKDLHAQTGNGRNRWKVLVQRAGTRLVWRGELRRWRGRWALTERGRQRAEAEKMQLSWPMVSEAGIEPMPSHGEIQDMLVDIGRALGKYAEKEHQRYDVVWKDSEIAPRLSHVFEVQVKGHIESALAKLKHAYDTQRSKPILVISDERQAQRARRFLQPYLTGSFHEIGAVTTVFGVQDVRRLHQSLHEIEDLLEEIL